MITGLNPITLDNYDIRDWIMMNPNNLILNIIDNNNNNNKNELFLINKNILELPNLKNIFNKCIYQGNIFLPTETYKSKPNYINIGYLVGKKCLVTEKNINKVLSNKLNSKIINLEITNTQNNYISREYLLLQYIGLYKQVIKKNDSDEVKKEKQEYNKNIPYKLDVYFEKILSDALTDYSNIWDAPINYYLRQGETYFDTDIFNRYRYRYGNTKAAAISNIKTKIENLDRVFLEAATRNEDDKKIYWRGMKSKYDNLYYINDRINVPNFLSLTENKMVAINFSKLRQGETCCLYKFTIDKGVPIINMINTTKYKTEKETLLPRNVTCTLIDKEYITYGVKDIPVYTLNVSLNNISEYKINNMCYAYYDAILTINKDKELLHYIENKNNVNIKQNKSVKQNKKTRCPNGTRRNKISGLCEPLIKNNMAQNVENIVLTKKNKKQRCPNGTKRNKISGLCEPK